MSESPIRLIDLQNRIQSAIREKLDIYYWVVAEISELSVNFKGHCYLSLIENDKSGENLIAKARAIIWASRFRMLSAYFESASGESLKSGIKVLVKASVDYHELYGLSLQIIDIDPTYTLGDLEAQRREIIKKLEAAGIINMNKTLELPVHIQKIAIISSDTAAGFGDFVAHLESNSQHYAYHLDLYKAAMQGVDTEKTVVQALENIYNAETQYDVVVIIRGGGSRTDLSAFDNFEIAANIAQFPIPVLSGIGHERDASVVDLVAFKHLKTPTAVAEFILEHTEGLEESLDYEFDRLMNALRNYLTQESTKFIKLSTTLIPVVKQSLNQQNNKLATLTNLTHKASRNAIVSQSASIKQLEFSMTNFLQNYFKESNNRLNMHQLNIGNQSTRLCEKQLNYLDKLEQKIISNDPKRLLEKGFSLTTVKGKPIASIKSIQSGDILKTWLNDGTVESEVL
jgi:exodeoxyribonuclease VII large subunit